MSDVRGRGWNWKTSTSARRSIAATAGPCSSLAPRVPPTRPPLRTGSPVTTDPAVAVGTTPGRTPTPARAGGGDADDDDDFDDRPRRRRPRRDRDEEGFGRRVGPHPAAGRLPDRGLGDRTRVAGRGPRILVVHDGRGGLARRTAGWPNKTRTSRPGHSSATLS